MFTTTLTSLHLPTILKKAVRSSWNGIGAIVAVIIILFGSGPAEAQAFQKSIGDPPSIQISGERNLPYYLQDRGTGIPVSMFGTFVRPGQLLFYSFFEYYHDRDAEYAPDEFGFAETNDYFGNFIGREWLVWVGYGITDRLAVEFETAYLTNATLDKDPDDPSGMPTKIHESGLGDVEGQIRWRWTTEDEKRPEIFSYYETVFPLQKNKQIIGTSIWEFKLGTGLIKGFRWGTVVARVAVEYSDEGLEPGEFGVEYLKRISPGLRLFAGVEGAQDEWELITEVQWHVSPRVFVKFNNAFGVTAKATDWAPEIGVMFSFGSR